MAKRLTEIDALRGLAVCTMVIYHLAFQGVMLGVFTLDLRSAAWVALARFTQFLFLPIVGVSIFFSGRDLVEQLRRSAVIFLGGMLMTLGTYFFIPHAFVRFGVLHFIAFAIPIVYLFKNHPRWALFAAAVAFSVGRFFSGLWVENEWLFWLGLNYKEYQALDHFPIFPWLAAPLVGLAIGHCFYAKRKPTALACFGKIRPLVWIGRHALLIYIIHHPIIFAGVSLLAQL